MRCYSARILLCIGADLRHRYFPIERLGDFFPIERLGDFFPIERLRDFFPIERLGDLDFGRTVLICENLVIRGWKWKI